jgi:hypothetical protein
MSNSFRMRPYGQSLAIVVFGPSSLRHLQCLKAGYQHCSVITQDRGLWHMMDPLLNGTHIRVLGEAGSTKVIRVFKDDGYEAIADQRLAPICKEMPLAPYICVEAVKRVPGIQDRWLLTTWQLRQSLSRFYGYQ